MSETFACPECGGEVELLGAAPGREVQCAHCEAWLEVPYLPRGGVWTRPRFRRTRAEWLIRAGWTGVGVLAVVVAVVSWGRVSSSRGRAARDAALDSMLASADAAEKAHRADRALSEIEAALALLAADDARCADRRAALMARRDGLSVREAEGRISAAAKAEPDAAVGDLLSLQARARTDRALEPLVPAILGAIDAARQRQAAAAIVAARRAVAEKRPLDALAAGERALAVADKLMGEPARSLSAEAEGLLAPVLARLGVVIVQLPGRFTLGSPPVYESAMGPIIAEALRRKGYAPRPAAGPARALWDRHAVRRMDVQVMESPGVLYLESQNRITQIVTSLNFTRGLDVVWQANVTARTQVPLPALPVYTAGRRTVGHSADVEHALYQDAFASALDQVAIHLRALPGP